VGRPLPFVWVGLSAADVEEREERKEQERRLAQEELTKS